MVRKEQANEHNIHNGGMIGNDDVLPISLNFLLCLCNKTVPEPHTVEQPKAPYSHKKVGIFVVFFTERKKIHRQEAESCKQTYEDEEPATPEIVQDFSH